MTDTRDHDTMRDDAEGYSIESLLAERDAMRAALKPFADYAAGGAAKLPPDHVITQGSSMARRQLTIGDCLNAAEVLA